MRPQNQGRLPFGRFVLLSLVLVSVSCTQRPAADTEAGSKAGHADSGRGPGRGAAGLRDEVPLSEMEAVMRSHLEGLGHMERYEYDQAARAFRNAHERAPGWVPGSINLAIALLNQTGNQAEAASGASSGRHFEDALGLLDGVLQRDPANLHAHYCRGIILEYLGRLSEAHRDFVFVADHDPTDAHAWFKVGSTLADPENPERPAGPKQAKALIEIYSKAVERNPYLVSALYKLQTAYAWAGERGKQGEVLQLWRRLNPKSNAAGPGETADTFYGEMGRYAQVIDPARVPRAVASPALAPRLGPAEPLRVTLPDGDRWVRDDDFVGPLAVLGRARACFGAAVVTFDANGDGRADLYLASAVRGDRGVRDALLLNQGEGRFEDATARFGIPADQASLGVAAGDFDADRRIDLFLTGVGRNRLYRATGARFEDVTAIARLDGPAAISPTARWLDLDQDGDLDLYIVNYTSLDHAEEAFTGKMPPGMANAAYRNDGQPAPVAGRPQDNWAPLALAPSDLPATAGLSIAFRAWPESEALTGGGEPHTGVAALDIDDDRDIDLVLSAHAGGTRAAINDRLGRFHAEVLEDLAPVGAVSGLLVTELDKDGKFDLVTLGASGEVVAWRNTTTRGARRYRCSWERWPTDARGWREAVAVDLDLDTWPDLVGLPSDREARGPVWAHNQGRRLAASSLALAPDRDGPAHPVGLALGDLVGDSLPDLIVVGQGTGPRLAPNLGNGHHWLALDLSGRWKVPPDHMRSNPHGLGTRVALEGEELRTYHAHTTPVAGLGQSVGPILLGMGKVPTAALLRLRWPDGTMQCELNVTADKVLALAEHNRKTGSCPVLFTWNGERFECLGDFLGGGGLGYLVALGVYGQPDRDEAMAIAPGQLRAERDVFRLAVTEPMDEVAYLDRLSLDVVDCPPGVSATPDERFAPTGPRPSGEMVAWRTAIEPVRAVDLDGRNVTERLRRWDRRTVDRFSKRPGWIGYADEHGIVLDFGDRLRGFSANEPLVLCLAGWVEYPYSQTNYAAATAGVALRPPALERLQPDGSWTVIEPHAGYPAGLPRMTTLDVTGKLGGPRCVIRLRTNMECYWDQAFIAVRERDVRLRVTSLGVSRAELHDRGYTREFSPDGALPLLYDYEHVEAAPLARLTGRLTRHGDVAALLRSDDDQLCVLGPGDEVRLEFDARRMPELPDGWTRSFVFRAIGYCKDADPFTAASDSVGPLPWKRMPAYPFGPEGERPPDRAYQNYLDEYQTRPAGEP